MRQGQTIGIVININIVETEKVGLCEWNWHT